MPAPRPDFSHMPFIPSADAQAFEAWLATTPFNPDAPSCPLDKIVWKEVYVLFRLERRRKAEGRELPGGNEYTYLQDKYAGVPSAASATLRECSRTLQEGVECSLKGRPLPPAFETRMVDLLRLAESGDARALDLAAFVFDHPAFPQSRALNARLRVFAYRREACERGYFAPLVMVARHLALGDGVPADAAAARGWFEDALVCEEPSSWCNLAHDLVSGLHGFTDCVRAELLLRRGVESGQMGCAAELAILLLGHKLPGPDSPLPLLESAANALVGEALLVFGACLLASAQDHRLGRVGSAPDDPTHPEELYRSGLKLVTVAAASRIRGADRLLASVDGLPLWNGEEGRLDGAARALAGLARPVDISKGVLAAALELEDGPLPKGVAAAGPMERLDFESDAERAAFEQWLLGSPLAVDGQLPDEGKFDYLRLYLLFRANARRRAEGRELSPDIEFGYIRRQSLGENDATDQRCEELTVALSRSPDEGVVAEILDLAQRTGHPAALFLAWGCHANGLGTPVDTAAAFRCLRDACEAGYMGLAWHMVEAYERGLGVEADPDAAAAWFRDALLFSIPGNAVSVALGALSGIRGKVDPQYPELILRRSVQMGDGVAGMALATAMLEGRFPDTGDIPTLLRAAAGVGDPVAWYRLGEGYLEAAVSGRRSRVFLANESLPGPKKLFATAVSYLRKAADAEFPPAKSLFAQIRVYHLSDGSRATLAGGVVKEKKAKKEAEAAAGRRRR